jgi:hypothetical protein
VRYRLQIPVIFSWENPLGSRFRGEGVTRDISEFGAYVVSATCPPLMSEVEVEIVFSAVPKGPKAWLSGKMQVVRREDESNGPGGRGFSLSGKAFAVCATAKE